MKENQKPNFEKLAKKAFPITDTSTFSGLMQDGYKEGCERIWTDYVVPNADFKARLRAEVEKRKSNLNDMCYGRPATEREQRHADHKWFLSLIDKL